MAEKCGLLLIETRHIRAQLSTDHALTMPPSCLPCSSA